MFLHDKYKTFRLSITVLSIFWIMSTLPATAAVVETPQTGQTTSHVTGDDGDLKTGKSWPSPRFSDNGDGTITDNLTGLMWLQDVGCADSSGYISGAAVEDWERAFEFIERLNRRALLTNCINYAADYSDWRLPNITELISLFRAGFNQDSYLSDWLIDTPSPSGRFLNTGFLLVPAWSSTTFAADTSQAWAVDFRDGSTLTVDKANQLDAYTVFGAVRNSDILSIAVSGQTTKHRDNDDGDTQNGVVWPEPRFVELDDGTVVDKLTGLVWLQSPGCINLQSTWSSAINNIIAEANSATPFASCTNFTSELTEWRVPNLFEQFSLIDFSRAQSAVAEAQLFDLPGSLTVWTSTSSNDLMGTNAWSVNLSNGELLPKEPKSTFGYSVWPVTGPIDYPDIRANPTSVSFGSYFVGQDNIEVYEITLSNPGNVELAISDIDLELIAASTNEFLVTRDQCSNSTLRPDENCTFEIRFVPKNTGARQARIIVNSDALGIARYAINVSGGGLHEGEDSNSACLIATAAYGSYLEPEVEVLRKFRDDVLLKSDIGRSFVSYYYEHSPAIANYIRKNDNIRGLFRATLAPIVFCIKHPSIPLAACAILLVTFLLRRTYFAHA